MSRKLKVDAIKNGTVIDHIPAGKSLQIAEVLGLDAENEVMIGMNLASKKLGKKDIIKIENRVLSPEQVNSIALISPSTTIIIIKAYTVVEKFPLQLPDRVEGLIVCPNPNCITNAESIASSYQVYKNPLQVRCLYCEKKYEVDEVRFSI